jgi:hypothetical protein
MNNGLLYTFAGTNVVFWSIQKGTLGVHINEVDIFGQYSNPYKDKSCILNID